MARVAAGEGVDGASSAGSFRTGTAVSCARPDPPRRRHTAWGVVLVDMVVLLCECKRGTPRPRLEKRCSPFRVEAAPDGVPEMAKRPAPRLRSFARLRRAGRPSEDERPGRRKAPHQPQRCRQRHRGVVRSRRDIRRSRDLTTEVVDSSAGHDCERQSTDVGWISNDKPRRLATRAVPVRTPTGSLPSLPLLSGSRKGPAAPVPCALCPLLRNVLGLTF